jgi:hypothetical protein
LIRYEVDKGSYFIESLFILSIEKAFAKAYDDAGAKL